MSENLDKMFRIFVSSVGSMMTEERNTLVERIWLSGHHPIAMEGFSGNHEQKSIDVIIQNLDKADIVIFVLGFTYGSIIGDALKCKDCQVKQECPAKKRLKSCEISYTHFEYLYAQKTGKLTYCIIQSEISMTQKFQKRLEAFLRSHFNSNEEKQRFTETINENYYKHKEEYEKFIKNVSGRYSCFYDADPSPDIIMDIIDKYAIINGRFDNDARDIPGLIDWQAYDREIIKKN